MRLHRRPTAGGPPSARASAEPVAVAASTPRRAQWASLCGSQRRPWNGRSCLIRVGHRDADDFLGGGEASEDLANPILAQGAHAHLAGSLAQLDGRGLLIDHVPHFVIDLEDLEDTHPAFVTEVL